MTATTPIDQLARAASQRLDARVFCDDECISYQELYESSLRCARGLKAIGISEGDRVALWIPNGRAYLDLLYACMHINAIAVAVNSRFRTSEVRSILQRTGAKAIAIAPQFNGIDYQAMLAEVLPEDVPDLKTEIICGLKDADASPRSRIAYQALTTFAPIVSEARPDAPAAIFSTSGTTNLPKFALHKQGVIALHAQQVSDFCAYEKPGTHLMQAIPFCGIFGFSQWIATVAGGASCTILPLFDARRAGDLIRARDINYIHGPDDLLKRLLDAFPNEERPFPSLDTSVYAGFNPTLATFPQEAERRGIHLIGAFGMSEIYSFVSLWPKDAPLEVRARSGGLLVNPEATIRARDVETGQLSGTDQVGELEIRSSTLFSGYFGDDAATAAAFTDDGYFRTGDLGAVAADGSFRFLGRNGDFLRLGGFLVNPMEIEVVIQKLPEIETAIVVEIGTARGNKAIAFVKLAPDAILDEQALRSKLIDLVADYKVPSRIIAIEQFPTTMGPNGEKIQRSKVRTLAQNLQSLDAR